MPFSKIKYSLAKGVTLTRVEDRSNEDSIESTLTSHDLPRPEFVTALQELKSWVVKVCDLPHDYAEGMTVVGVSLSLGEYGGCVVTALKKVSGATAPVVINSPHVPATPTSDGGCALPITVQDMLTALEEEAQRYWDGERAQADLFGKDDPEDEELGAILDQYDRDRSESLKALEIKSHKAVSPAVKKAFDRLRPSKKSGISKVSISFGGKTVDLPPKDAFDAHGGVR